MNEAYAERLRLENKGDLASNGLGTEERAALIKQSFMPMSQLVEQRLSTTSLDWQCVVAVIVVAAILCVAWIMLPSIAPTYLATVMISLLAAGLLAIMWMFATIGRRFINRKVVPQLSAALRPLKPTLLEIGVVLSDFKRMRYKLGSTLRAEDLLKAIGEI